MESSASSSAPDDPPRVKFLCSFGGSILPRPLDARLRYVGGETRIVSLPRHVSYPDLLARMCELFEGVAVIKYQQPDEDLDALVSVVNGDDVMNMMEEYDKLGAAGDAFTRLRIFLFSQQHPDFELAVSHFDADERETERRYVDALNSLADTTMSPASPDTPEQFSRYPSTDGGIPSHLSLDQINIPHPSHTQRYGEVEAPWSPAYFSPAHHLTHDPREFPPSPSSSRFHLAAGEFNDGVEEFGRYYPGHLAGQYDHQPPPYAGENMLWLPPGLVGQEKSGFPGNLGHVHNVFEGSSVCEQCRMTFPRNPITVPDSRYLDPRWKHGQPQMEQANTGNEYGNQFSNSSRESYQNREAYMLNPDVKLDHGVYVKDQSEHYHSFYNEGHGPNGGWVVHQPQVNHRLEEPRVHLSGSGRVGEHYVVDGHAMNVPFVPGNFYEGPLVPSNYINHDGNRFCRPGTELGNEMLHSQQTIGAGAHAHMPGFEDTTVRFGIPPPAYGADNLYQVQQNLPPIPSLRRKAQVSMPPGTSYESTVMMAPNGGISPGFIRSPHDGSPSLLRIGVESQIQNSWAGQNGSTSRKILGFDESAAPEYLYDHAPRMSQNFVNQDGRISVVPDPVQHQTGALQVDVPAETVPLSVALVDDKLVASPALDYHQFSKLGNNVAPIMRILEEKIPDVESYEAMSEEKENGTVVQASSPSKEKNLDFDANKRNAAERECQTVNFVDSETEAAKEHGGISVECLSFLPELIASVKKAALESAEVVKAKVEADANENETSAPAKKKSSLDELEPGNACADLQADSDSDGEHQKISKIEPTTAEAEALSKGLQTIRNDDLEEIKVLGTGTYGTVHHGKWKGSDVAIKRIKASCFAGRPSERERLIADFWKEALILSSLHHPNVVSLYGVVRDGPDGSLATVTEFMINGSLKQFLQKKDRTIDRRKRLIIAMDAAFGMEYLHGKNIVHFDLKCENLLVNMRDPHRPVCKIGDLGLSKVKQHTLVSGGVRGTLPWMAPELLSGRSNMVTEMIDVYSFGIVMWELLTGEEPYADMRCASVIGGIVNNSLRPQIPTWCDPEWKSLMESCWSSDPGERPSFSEISQKLRKMAASINVK